MGAPANGPATLAGVKGQLGIADDDQGDDETLLMIVAAVNAKVSSWPVAEVADQAATWDDPKVAHLVLGATMLVARLARRRDSPDGVAAFGQDGPVYVQRNDPDVAMLLELGTHARPMVG